MAMDGLFMLEIQPKTWLGEINLKKAFQRTAVEKTKFHSIKKKKF